MKNPFRTEAEAFSFVIVCVLLFGAVALGGTGRPVGSALRLPRARPLEWLPAST